MSPVFIIALVLVTLFITFQIYVFVKSKKSVGNPIPFDKINNEGWKLGRNFNEKHKNLENNLSKYTFFVSKMKEKLPFFLKKIFIQ